MSGKTLLILALAALCTGCPSANFRSEISVAPAPEPGQFIVRASLYDEDKEERLIAKPVKLAEGERAELDAAYKKLHALFTMMIEQERDKVFVRTSVAVDKCGKDIWSERSVIILQNSTMNWPPPPQVSGPMD